MYGGKITKTVHCTYNYANIQENLTLIEFHKTKSSEI